MFDLAKKFSKSQIKGELGNLLDTMQEVGCFVRKRN